MVLPDEFGDVLEGSASIRRTKQPARDYDAFFRIAREDHIPCANSRRRKRREVGGGEGLGGRRVTECLPFADCSEKIRSVISGISYHCTDHRHKARF